MLLVDLKTGLGKTPCQNSCFWGECLYVVCAQNDQELKIRTANRSFLEVVQTIHFDKKSIFEPAENDFVNTSKFRGQSFSVFQS
jgi:hypothetical protein